MTKERRKSISSMPYSSQASWKMASSVGGKLPRVRPLFTQDCQHLVVVTSQHLKVFSLETKHCIRSLPVNTADITDIFEYSPGKIFISKFNDRSLVLDQSNMAAGLETIDIKKPIVRVIAAASDDTKPEIFCALDHHGALQFGVLNLESGDFQIVRTEKNVKLYAFAKSSRYLALHTSKHKKDELIIMKFNEDFTISGKERIIKRLRPVSSLAVSDNGIVAVGTPSGVIDLYYDNGDDSVVRTLKWHVDSVLTLEFSLDGDYLLSGGHERVLVFWQLETGNTQFLPRLDGEIDAIYVNPTSQLYALLLSDEELLILSAVDLESRLQISGVKASFVKTYSDKDQKRKKKKLTQQQQQQPQIEGADINQRAGDYTCQYYIHPITKHAYFPTKTMSQIQIYNPIKDQQEKVFSVASAIQTGKVRSETLIEDPIITLVSFSHDGTWMATVDKRSNPLIDSLISNGDVEINLKFWKFVGGEWVLTTRVSSPHGPNKLILDLVPTSSGGFITAAEDGGVRLWGVTLGSKRSSGVVGVDRWSVRKVLSSHANKSSAVSLAVSEDMSVIALGFENTIYIIDGKKFEIVSTIPNILGSRVRDLRILGTCLVALSKSRIVVWDLLTGRERWAMGVQAPTNGKRLIDYDAVTNTICFAYNFYSRDFRLQSKLFFLSLESPFAVHIENFATAISAVRFVPGGSSNVSFVDVRGQIHSMKFGSKSKGKPTEKDSIAADDFEQQVLALYANSRSTMPSSMVIDSDMATQNRALNVDSFESAFGNTDLSLEAMFDSVLSIVSPRATT